MSSNRFLEIMRHMRFELKILRTEDLKMIHLHSKLLMCYKPEESITADQPLYPSVCRCLESTPNKPDKFGIKFWLAVDVSSKYIINTFPYLGKDDSKSNDLSVRKNATFRLI
ncbi:hypothetical protein X975_04739, partial [Stegodyphus mimosarum]